jgi:hypothetical protein
VSIVSAPWFYWALILAIGLPTALVLLTELHNSLNRRGSAMAKPVGLLRNYVLPLGAVLLLIVQTSSISAQTTGVRIVTTAFGFLVLLMLLIDNQNRFGLATRSLSYQTRNEVIWLFRHVHTNEFIEHFVERG